MIEHLRKLFFKKGFSIVIDGTEGPNIFRVYQIGNQVCGPEIVHFSNIDKMLPWLDKQHD